MIAGNQIAHSGSAKTIVENYLLSFDASVKDLDEIQMALKLVASICDGVSPRILAGFLHDALTFLHGISMSSNFEEKCQLEVGLESIAKAFDKKCLSENMDIIIDEISRFNDNLPNDSTVSCGHTTYSFFYNNNDNIISFRFMINIRRMF